MRSTKFFDGLCDPASVTNSQLYATMRSNYTDSNGVVSARPHVINCSWGVPAGTTAFVGSEADARTPRRSKAFSALQLMAWKEETTASRTYRQLRGLSAASCARLEAPS